MRAVWVVVGGLLGFVPGAGAGFVVALTAMSVSTPPRMALTECGR